MNRMLDTFLATISSMMVMLMCIVIGFILRKSGLLPENTTSVLSKLVLYVFAPVPSAFTVKPSTIILAFIKSMTIKFRWIYRGKQ